MSPYHYSILYRNISNDFAEKLVFKIKEKLCEERRFGVWKTLKTQELPGALPPGPPPGRCPWTPPGALERAPGPHAVKTHRSLRSLGSTWTQTIFLQHPAVTNPAHAHDVLVGLSNIYLPTLSIKSDPMHKNIIDYRNYRICSLKVLTAQWTFHECSGNFVPHFMQHQPSSVFFKHRNTAIPSDSLFLSTDCSTWALQHSKLTMPIVKQSWHDILLLRPWLKTFTLIIGG